MSNHRARSGRKSTLSGGLLLSAVASSALAAGAMGGAGTAAATCASISGISAGSGCTSSVSSVAVGLGNGTKADAQGLFNNAVAIGTNAQASSSGAFNTSLALGNDSRAVTVGNLNLAVAAGTKATAIAGGTGGDVFNTAITAGNDSTVLAGGQGAVFTFLGLPVPAGTQAGFGNLGLNLGNKNSVAAVGGLNAASNLGGSGNTVEAVGVANTATQVGGSDNNVQAFGGTGLTNPGLNSAFSFFGSKNLVSAGTAGKSGPFAVAGVIGRSDLNGKTSVVQPTTGFNIKGPFG